MYFKLEKCLAGCKKMQMLCLDRYHVGNITKLSLW